jgi:hypothetical protein
LKAEFDRLKGKGYTDEAFHKYINNPNVKGIFTPKELTELKNLWNGQPPITVKEVIIEEPIIKKNDYKDMNKDELDEHSINTYGIDLDKRFSKQKMIEELEDKLKKQHPLGYNHEE